MVHEKLFEADPNIQYTYAWDRLNEYRQVSVSVAMWSHESMNMTFLVVQH